MPLSSTHSHTSMPSEILNMVVPAITEILYPFSNRKPSHKVKLLVLFWSIWCMAIFWNAQHPTTDLLLVDTTQSMTRTSSSIDIICLGIVVTGFAARCLIALHLVHVLLLLALAVCIMVTVRLYYSYLKRHIDSNPKIDADNHLRYIVWLCRRAIGTRNRLVKLCPETADLAWDVLEYMGLLAWCRSLKLVEVYDSESRMWRWIVIEVQDDQPIPKNVDTTTIVESSK